jgi:LysR family transcriptional regulator, regulator for bpeEF and oprC
MDKFAALQAFARVVECGSFTKAAASLGATNAAVTRSVQDLEAHLRTKLIHRTTRRLNITPDGQRLYERAAGWLDDWQALEASVVNAQASPRGRLRVDIGAALARQFLIPALPAFHARYPDIEISLGVGDGLTDLIGQNIDCVIRGGVIEDESLVARKLGVFNYVTCATPQYLRTHGVPRHPSDLEAPAHRVLSLFKPGSGELRPMAFERSGQRLTVQGRSVLSLNESNAYVAAGLAGLGVMSIAAFLVSDALADGRLVRLLPDWACDEKPIYIAHASRRHMSTRLRVFIDWVVQLFEQEPLFRPGAMAPTGAVVGRPRTAAPTLIKRPPRAPRTGQAAPG